MSLINDALKKAQTDVVRGGPPNPMAGSLAGAHVRPQKQNPFFKLAVLALFLGASVWAVSFFLGSSDEPTAVVEVAAATPAALEAAPEVEVVASAPVAAPAVETPVANEESLQAPAVVETPPAEVVSAPVETAAPVAESLPEPVEAPVSLQAPVEEPAPEAPAQVAVAETAPAVPPAAVEAPKPSTDQALRDEIIYTLKQLEITAVMGDGSKARIMSGGQIHKAGELINLDLKIRFQGKKGKTLYFTDAADEIYEKAL